MTRRPATSGPPSRLRELGKMQREPAASAPITVRPPPGSGGLASAAPEIVYHLHRRAGGALPGRHRGRSAGAGLEPFESVAIDRSRGRLRFDIAGSLRDAQRRLLVRVPRQLAAVDVQLAIDTSRSMLASDAPARRWLIAQLARAIGASAVRAGDAFGIVPFAEHIDPGEVHRPVRNRTAVEAAVQRMAHLPFAGRHARGIVELPAHVRRGHGVVFLLSDFLMPLDDLRRAVEPLAGHVLVPLVAWRPDAVDAPLRDGLTRVEDRETGRRRWLWMRPRLRSAIRARSAAHAQSLVTLFARVGARPFFLGDRLDCDALNAHLAR